MGPDNEEEGENEEDDHHHGDSFEAAFLSSAAQLSFSFKIFPENIIFHRFIVYEWISQNFPLCLIDLRICPNKKTQNLSVSQENKNKGKENKKSSAFSFFRPFSRSHF